MECTGVEVEHAAGGLLKRVYFDGLDIRSAVYVGNNHTAQVAAEVYARIPDEGSKSVSELAMLSGYPLDAVRSVLYIMDNYYGLVRVSSQQ